MARRSRESVFGYIERNISTWLHFYSSGTPGPLSLPSQPSELDLELLISGLRDNKPSGMWCFATAALNHSTDV